MDPPQDSKEPSVLPSSMKMISQDLFSPAQARWSS